MGKHWVLGALFGLAAVVLTAGGCRDGASSTWSDAGGDVDGGGSHPADSNAPTVDAEVDSAQPPEPDSGNPVWTPANDPCPTLADIDFFVDQNHPSASDSNPGTEAAPWETLTKAGESAEAGNCVAVKAGTYAETLAPANSGTAENVITFKAYPGDECKGGYEKSDCRVVLDNGGVLLTSDHIRIDGFDIRNDVSRDDAVTVLARGAEVVNNLIHGAEGVAPSGSGVWIAPLEEDILIENNEIHDQWVAVKGDNGTQTDVVIRGNNLWMSNDGFVGGGTRVLFESNWVHDANPLGGHCDALDLRGRLVDSVLRNNLMYDWSQLFYFSPPDERLIDNVHLYGNVLYLREYYSGDPEGESPGIKIGPDHGAGLTVRNLYIYNNTFGWLGMTRGYKAITIDGGCDFQTPLVLRNNVMYESWFSIDLPTDKVDSDYNLFLGEGESRGSQFEGPHTIFGQDPRFVDYRQHEAWDLHLQPGSPAIDQGDPDLDAVLPLPVDFSDADGTARREGDRCDLGAYEFIP